MKETRPSGPLRGRLHPALPVEGATRAPVNGKKVLVVGLGRSGMAVTRFLLQSKAAVTVTDLRDDPELRGSLASAARESGREPTLFLGGHDVRSFLSQDLICVSPGVSWGEGLLKAKEKGIPILGELELAFRFLRAPVVAVTGTNGKSTVTSLIGALLERGGKRVEVAGNIGRPLMEVVMEEKKPLDWVVTEVSSYQLETTCEFHARVAVLLNITEDHLDRYPSMKAYAETKWRIFNRQTGEDLAIYNEEDPWVVKGVPVSGAKRVGFSLKENWSANEIRYGGESYPLARVKLVGRHNVENIIAGVAAARFCGVAPETVQEGIEAFEGLPHRIEFVREAHGVRYYDDSKGTNVDAVVRALENFQDGKVLLIAGGKEKGGSYAPLREMVRRKVKQLLLIGEAAPQMKKELPPPSLEAGTLDRAVREAASLAAAGDVVLLSPACSSFDQFKNYKERGDVFRELVRKI